MKPGTWFRVKGRDYRARTYTPVHDMSPEAANDFVRRGWEGLGVCQGVRGAVKLFWVRAADGAVIL